MKSFFELNLSAGNCAALGQQAAGRRAVKEGRDARRRGRTALEVLVLLSFVAVVFSWTTMVRMSPTSAGAFVGEHGFRSVVVPERLGRTGTGQKDGQREQREPGGARRMQFGRCHNHKETRMVWSLKDFAADVAAGCEVADADDLAGNAVFQRLHFQ